ncbi:MAG TPA: glutamate 5-kinase, partial [Campylobacteraceae bacterium]|nr:glutamate 5-kinase [Campylobacteraceae bacterium]
VINENDVTATEELVFGDNDQLSAHVAYYFDADMLVILSDIDGYYDADPRQDSAAKIRPKVSGISEEETEIPCNPNHQFATGGIATKLKAAKFLLEHDREMYMTSGFDLSDARNFLLEGEQSGGTHFVREGR